MAERIDVRIYGFKELERAFRELSDEMQAKVAFSATAAAATEVRKRAENNLRYNQSANRSAVDTGALLKNVIIKRLPKKESPPFHAEHVVTVRGRGKKVKKNGKTSYQGGAWYGHLIEFGTVKMPAEPFLRPALDVSKQRAIQAMATRLKVAIARANRTKLPKKVP